MALSSGTRLGPYEILSAIGAGGMGEVYRARDTRLDRTVAIKVLPASVTTDTDRLRRFEQEARTIAALDHPNILALHDIGAHQGAPYLVSEFLEGETLRERLQQGPLPQRKGVEYALEVARGLDAAHDKGIVHRDLKPENIFLTRDSRVKILDFGLAKLAHQRAAVAGEGATASQTTPGVVMGTVGYMSPEQVRGGVLDHRSDIFSYGAVLYEMLAGQPAFKRDSSVETMNAILKDEPPEFVARGLQVAPGLQRIVQRCLEKLPEERFQSARDLAFAIDALSGSTASNVQPAQPARPARRTWTALALVLLAAAVFVVGRYSRPETAIRPTIHQLTFRNNGALRRARFAPDGRTIIYGAEWNQPSIRLYSVRTDSPESEPLNAPAAGLFSVSRNSELAVELDQPPLSAARPGRLARMPISGGAARELAVDVVDADWSPDGTQLALVRQIPGGMQLEFPAGKVLYKTGGWIQGVRFSPTGDVMAFLDHPLLGDDRGFVAMLDLNGMETRLTPELSSADGVAWSPDGQELWFSGAHAEGEPANGIYRVSRAGKMRQVMPSLVRLQLHDIAPDGRVLLSRRFYRLEAYGGEVAGGARLLSGMDGIVAGPFSKDGTLLVMTAGANAAPAAYQFYLARMDGAAPTLLGEGWGTDISPDNRWVVAVSEHVTNEIRLVPTGAGHERRIPTGVASVTTARWFPDGQRLLVQGYEPGHRQRLYVLDLSGGPARPITPEGVGTEGGSQGGFTLSADGQYIAASDEQGKWLLFPVDGSKPVVAIPGIAARERPVRIAGGYAYVVALLSVPQPVYKIDVETGQRTLFTTVNPGDISGAAALFNLILAEDGKHYAYTLRRDDAALFVVDGLR